MLQKLAATSHILGLRLSTVMTGNISQVDWSCKRFVIQDRHDELTRPPRQGSKPPPTQLQPSPRAGLSSSLKTFPSQDEGYPSCHVQIFHFPVTRRYDSDVGQRRSFDRICHKQQQDPHLKAALRCTPNAEQYVPHWHTSPTMRGPTSHAAAVSQRMRVPKHQWWKLKTSRAALIPRTTLNPSCFSNVSPFLAYPDLV
ncbi:uncharacterized protein LY89DRAFT_681119 [Mollisia scopiformis]|uniref:Uncharacterized protein n=1 Tax=Mollisia scopiformis TaxID=149040 RepID=A0A194XPM1_MOLSC|nr:uncharacterized protein LY89DRAFT_681119 [Mollisia scopiformis]KUJ21687.1 hypothetical protein LY89DRAFT_681119 [Mollisia scopiformis]